MLSRISHREEYDILLGRMQQKILCWEIRLGELGFASNLEPVNIIYHWFQFREWFTIISINIGFKVNIRFRDRVIVSCMMRRQRGFVCCAFACKLITWDYFSKRKILGRYGSLLRYGFEFWAFKAATTDCSLANQGLVLASLIYRKNILPLLENLPQSVFNSAARIWASACEEGSS